jgi:hypothetical protein
MAAIGIIERNAMFSPCRKWRYWLTRIWDDELPLCGLVGLNPSIADEKSDDATIRRCVSFAKQWGNGGMVMLNLFAIVATDPKRLVAGGEDLIGKENDRWLKHYANRCDPMFVAWGNLSKSSFRTRALAVRSILDEPLWCLGLTTTGFPRHPSRIEKEPMPIRFARMLGP